MQNGHRRFCSIVFSPLPSFYTLYCIIVFPAVQAVRILVHMQKDRGPQPFGLTGSGLIDARVFPYAVLSG